jgi:aspartate 1-decarboxylase
MKVADIFPYEQVQILNLNNGNRFTTYAIEGDKNEISLNGAAARLGEIGDPLIILSYCITDCDIKPKIIKFKEK